MSTPTDGRDGHGRALTLDLKTLVGSHDLAGAVEAATSAVKANPMDPSGRTALFELLCFEGNLERAEKQLKIIADESMEKAYGASHLKALLGSERQRRAVLAGTSTPAFAGTAPAWADRLVDLLDKPDAATAAALESERIQRKGTFNGRAFSTIRDGDDLLAPVLEVVMGGRYLWLDWNSVRSIKAEPPRALRDMFWFPVSIVLESDDVVECHVPGLYVNSHEAEGSVVRLGRDTEWNEVDGLFRGRGARLLFVDGEPLDVRSLEQLEFEG